MKKWVYAIIMLFILSTVIPCQAGETDEDKYKTWVEKEVNWLLSAEEEKEFKALQTDEERDKYIELFWAKRDPTPGTQENEFKVEWYKRFAYVEETFKSGPQRGVKSDMGRVYMLLGPPAQTKAEAGGMREESAGGTQLEAPPQIWVYQAMPELGLIDPFRVTFRQYQWGYDLDNQTDQRILRAMEQFPKVVQFNPDLKEMPAYRFKLDASSFEGQLINDFIASGQSAEQIPIQLSPHFSQAINQSTYIYFAVVVDTKKAGLKNDAQLTFFGRLEGEQGHNEEFINLVEPEKQKGDQIVVGFGVPVVPDTYTLYLGVRNSDKTKYSLMKEPLEVPNFWTGDLALSTIILSAKVEQVKKQKDVEPEEYNPYHFGQLKAEPRLDNSFKSSENLNVLFQIYNAKQIDSEVSLQVEYFIEAPEGTYRLNAQEIKQTVEAGKSISGGTEVPLAPLKPAEYTFKIKVIDKNATKIIEAKVPFTVK